MISPQKIAEVKQLIKNGLPEGEIKNQLLEQGYSQNEIEEVFKPKIIDMRSWYLTFGIIFTAFGLLQIINNGGFLIPSLGITLIILYIKEKKKFENNNENNS